MKSCKAIAFVGSFTSVLPGPDGSTIYFDWIRGRARAISLYGIHKKPSGDKLE